MLINLPLFVFYYSQTPHKGLLLVGILYINSSIQFHTIFVLCLKPNVSKLDCAIFAVIGLLPGCRNSMEFLKNFFQEKKLLGVFGPIFRA